MRPLPRIRRKHDALSGPGLALGLTLAYLALLVLIPMAGLAVKASSLGWSEFSSVVTTPRAMAAYRVSIVTALAAAVINTVFGGLAAWVLVRYSFPGRRVLDAMVDLPLALPTAVGGIALTAVYSSNGWIGASAARFGVPVAFTPLGITVALVFVGLPFVVRTVQPVLQDLEPELEEAAASLGATRMQTLGRIVWPAILPALLTGFALALARGLGEYGSVVFISGNLPMKTEVSTLLIMTKLEQYEYAAATAIAAVMLVLSFVLLLAINVLQGWTRRSQEQAA